MMEFSGVRSSWLTVAQNLSLDSEAARSRSDFSSSSAYSATTPRLVCSSSSDSSPYRAITPRLVSCSSALSRSSWSFCWLRSSSALIRSWFCRRSSSRADCGCTAASCSPTSRGSGRAGCSWFQQEDAGVVWVTARLGEQDGRYQQRVPGLEPGQGGGLPAAADAVGVQDDRRTRRRVVLELADDPGLVAGDAGDG